jgi:spore coat protein SA
MRLLEANGVQVTARIVGGAGFGGQETSEYVNQLKQNKPSNVEFSDYVSGPALAAEFRKAQIFCCPSTWSEPFGMVNVEAMATALPVIATAVGGIPEVFQEGGGLLIPSNSPGALAVAIELLLKDSAKRRQLSSEGYRAYQKRYRWQEIHAQYRELVDNLRGAA